MQEGGLFGSVELLTWLSTVHRGTNAQVLLLVQEIELLDCFGQNCDVVALTVPSHSQRLLRVTKHLTDHGLLDACLLGRVTRMDGDDNHP